MNNFCKHYRGMHRKDACEAGIEFSTLEHYGTKLFHDSCPCFGPEHHGRCDRKEYRSVEEMAAQEAEVCARFNAIGLARDAIVEHCGGPWKRGDSGTSDVIDCPVCGTETSLAFSRSGYNGHIHATCKTDDCVAWME